MCNFDGAASRRGIGRVVDCSKPTITWDIRMGGDSDKDWASAVLGGVTEGKNFIGSAETLEERDISHCTWGGGRGPMGLVGGRPRYVGAQKPTTIGAVRFLPDRTHFLDILSLVNHIIILEDLLVCRRE